MAKVGMLGVGIVLLVIAIIGYAIPVNDVDTLGNPVTITIPNAVSNCNTEWGQLGQAYRSDVAQSCSEYQMMLFGIYGSGVVGIILLIVGAVIPTSKEKSLTCKYCNFVGLSEAELLKHNAEKHLGKSPYICEHCDFIGISEEILWNHYNDTHPDKKKWKWN